MIKNGIMIIILLFLLAILLSACGGSGDFMELDVETNQVNCPWCNIIEDWQYRELLCTDNKDYIYTPSYFNIDLTSLVEIGKEVNSEIQQIADVPGDDYWQTSQETQERGEGDCEDLAILVWSRLRKLGYPDDLLYLFVGRRDGLFHVFVGVYYSKDAYFVIDPTTYYTKNILTDSTFLEKLGVDIRARFNLFSIQ